MLVCIETLEKMLGEYCAVDLLIKVSAFLNVSVSCSKKYSVLQYMLSDSPSYRDHLCNLFSCGYS